MSFSIQRVRVVLFVLTLVAVRFFYIDIPFVEDYNSISRQSIVASIVRNFYTNGYHFFYPEINENGAGPYLFNGEMPLYSYLMAIAYGLVGGVKEWAARSVSVIGSLLSLMFLYLLVRRLHTKKMALYALILFGFSPLNIALSRALQPEATMIMSTVGGLYFFCQYLSSKKVLYYVFSAFLVFIAVSTKIYNLYILLPIAFAAYQVDHWGIFRKRKYWIYLVLVGSSLFWYMYMWKMGQNLELAYTPYDMVQNRGPQDLTYFELLFNKERMLIFSKIFVGHLNTPIGFVLLCIGLFKARFDNKAALFYVWMLSVCIAILILWRTVIDHSYYQLPFILPCSYFVGYGLHALLQIKRKKTIIALLVFGLVLSSACVGRLYKGIYLIPNDKLAIVEAGKAADSKLPKDALLIATYGNSPIQLYYANRKGWVLGVESLGERELIKTLENLRAKGATHYLISHLVDFQNKELFKSYLLSNYRVMAEGSDYLLVDLT